MPRKKSRNPAAILSVSLPLTTRDKIDKFNPRNRSKFFNEAVLRFINNNDPEIVQNRLDEEENRDLVNPRLGSATPQQLLRALGNSNLLAEPANSFNPDLIVEIYSELRLIITSIEGDTGRELI